MSEQSGPSINETVKATGQNPYREPLTNLYTSTDHEEAEKINLDDVWQGWETQKQEDGSIIRTNPQTNEKVQVSGTLGEPGYRVTRL